MKTCSSCHIDKAPDEFYRNGTRPDGLGVHCRTCRREQERRRAQERAARAEIQIPPMKRCAGCRKMKPSADFWRNRTNADGLCDCCKCCGGAAQADYYAKHRESERSKRKAYYRDHVAQMAATARRWALAHPLDTKAIKHAYYLRNRGKYRLRQLEWIKANPQRALLVHRQAEGKRRARKRGGLVRPADFAFIMERDGMRCYLCGRRVTKRNLHFDHVIPLARGGAHSTDNIRVTHAFCNKSKGPAVMTLF